MLLPRNLSPLAQRKKSASFTLRRAFGSCLCAAGVFSGAAFAQEVQDVEDEEASPLEEIVVTGTRRQDRTVTESLSPIDVVGAEEIGSTGYTETNRILADLLPSFNFPLTSVTDGTDHIRPATLRGLSPDHTLVLINGKRRHTTALLNINSSVGRGSSSVDLNSIPSNMIARIEVLRDGASAQYGSDAIAGVINVVLKSAKSGGSANITLGQYNTTVADVPEPGAVDFVDCPTDDEPDKTCLDIATGDDITRKDGDTLTLGANVGFPLTDNGFLHLGLQWRDRDPANRSGRDIRENYPRLPDGSLDPREKTINRINHNFGNSKAKNLNFFYNAGYDIGQTELYLFGSYSTREGLSTGFYRRAQDNRNVLAIYPHGFLPEITTDIEDLSLALGARFNQAGWDIDASLTHGQNRLEYGVQNSLNASYGADSQTKFDAGALKFVQQTLNLDVYRLLDVGFLSSPLSLAVGAEYRGEDYKITAGEDASWMTNRDADGNLVNPGIPGGSQVFPGFQPKNAGTADRSSFGIYAEADTDFSSAINAALAVRFEDYTDFGSTFTAKLAARAELSSAVSLRGTVSTGFRAPSVAQSSFNTTSTNFIAVDGVATPFEVGTFAVDHPVARVLGATPLEAEESVNLSLGAVFQLFEGFNLTLDYYQIGITERIVLSETLREGNSPGLEKLLADAGLDANSARFFINGVDTTTKGFDIVAAWKTPLTLGDLSLSAALNLTKTTVDEVRDNLKPFGDAELNLFGRREQKRFENGAPRDKLTLSATWNPDPFTATLRATRYGETVDPSNNPDNDEILSPKWLVDLTVTYNTPWLVNITAGVNNLFDAYPDTSAPTSTFNRIFPFSRFSPFGFKGRYVYLRAGAKFDF